MIYLDNAATTLQKPPQVIAAVVRAMETLGNAARGAHGSSLGAAREIYGARVKLARLFGCGDPSRVIFTHRSAEHRPLRRLWTGGPRDIHRSGA